MPNKEIGKLTYKISVEDAEKSIVEAMEMSKSKLEGWCAALSNSGYQTLAEEVQEYIDIVIYLEETRDETTS